ncbi:glycosyltransferase family 4 protein [Candidatus Parcubacteria bacterium]|nr:glycosyltransferase family 4 protein [Candidatus Parcubacteria bacterium]
MRILYGITKSNWGGAQRYVYDLAIAAREAGHEVSVLSGGNGLMIKKLDEAGIRVISLPHMNRDIKVASELKSFVDIYKILRSERPDVFHINSSKMGGLGTFAARIAGVKKIIFTSHAWAFNESRHWLQRLIIEELSWLTVFLSHITICVSEQSKRQMETKPLIGEKLVVVHNGIDGFKLLEREVAREKLSLTDLPPDTILVGTISELHPNKGIDIMLRALNKTTENVHFAIAGTGEKMAELRQLAKILGVSGRVHFLGYVENAREYLKAFDIFTLTSRTESLPYVILEAGYAALPVVATRAGGIPEIITDGKTGTLVPRRDHKSLAAALSDLINDREKRSIFGENLSKFVKENFSKERMVRETFKIYQAA